MKRRRRVLRDRNPIAGVVRSIRPQVVPSGRAYARRLARRPRGDRPPAADHARPRA